MTNNIILILAGGAGTRFWPASREDKPKQFLDILGTGRTLLRQTFDRCNKIVQAENIYIVANAAYTDRIAHELPELDPSQIFAEPSRNNTAPCIAYASLKLQMQYPDAVCLVAPSDHLITDEVAFASTVRQAFDVAGSGDTLVTLGITPVRPDTGYGYIHYDRHNSINGAYRVLRFTEKPDMDTAQRFLQSGDYLWNSGMFVWSLDAVLRAFDAHAPEITRILRGGLQDYNTEREPAFLTAHYPHTEKISIDYAILERADNVVVIPTDPGWSDLGTWLALCDHLPKDTEGNITAHHKVYLKDCRGTLVHGAPGTLIVAAGLEDYIVICDNDVVLIVPKDREQDVRGLREEVRKKSWEEHL